MDETMIVSAMMAEVGGDRNKVQAIYEIADAKMRYELTDVMKKLAKVDQTTNFDFKCVKHKTTAYGGGTAKSWAEVLDEARKLNSFYQKQ